MYCHKQSQGPVQHHACLPLAQKSFQHWKWNHVTGNPQHSLLLNIPNPLEFPAWVDTPSPTPLLAQNGKEDFKVRGLVAPRGPISNFNNGLQKNLQKSALCSAYSQLATCILDHSPFAMWIYLRPAFNTIPSQQTTSASISHIKLHPIIATPRTKKKCHLFDATTTWQGKGSCHYLDLQCILPIIEFWRRTCPVLLASFSIKTSFHSHQSNVLPRSRKKLVEH